ncbi:MAG: DNA mismatch repair endonuclease MutL [Gemmatimonadota bacterium]|jgi:DNA mismatch repair protein MutL
MSRRIHILPDTVANQIAAGEVVERPVSVVKELVENALDAAATRVDVTIQNGGKTEVRVADDGTGMGRDDALLALDRHATSKIAQEEDLRSVRSFGFRGEALPSIASVSRLTLETAEAGDVGTRVRVSAGRILGAEDCARQRGTTVVVRNLFFNVPARAKFLKSAAVETRAIVDALISLALANLSASFHLESNGRNLLDLPPASDLVERVAALWGDAFAGRLVALAHELDGTAVAGLVARPDAASDAPRRVHLFVGGRPFRDRGLVYAAEQAYRTTVPAGAKPSLLLYLDVPAGAVDVNVHPSKAEVRFRERNAVERAVEDAVRQAVSTLASAATLDRNPTLPQLRRTVPPDGGDTGSGSEAVAASRNQLALFVPAVTPVETEEVDADAADAVPVESRYALWQVHDTYILAETRSGLIIIDQHSAHERILFERLMDAFDGGGEASQRLLFPLTLRLSPSEYSVVEDLQALFRQAGFEVEPFGGRTVIVHSAPNPHPYFDAERCLRDMIAELAEGSELTRSATNQYERLAKTFACKGAIKAGQGLAPDEMRRLFDELFETELPYHDVHGRPTVVRLSLNELERRFGRSG